MTYTGVTFYPSGPIGIRDATAERVRAVAGLKKVYSARTTPGQDSQMPYAIVWNAGERTKPNGDANVGAPEFEHALTLIIDVVVRAGSEAALDADIVALVETIRATLLTDPSWVAQFEGIEKVDTRYTYPKDAADIVVQAMIEIEVSFRSRWEPIVPHDLETVAVIIQRPPSAWPCALCGFVNDGSRKTCAVCNADAPAPTSVYTEFDLRTPTCLPSR